MKVHFFVFAALICLTAFSEDHNGLSVDDIPTESSSYTTPATPWKYQYVGNARDAQDCGVKIRAAVPAATHMYFGNGISGSTIVANSCFAATPNQPAAPVIARVTPAPKQNVVVDATPDQVELTKKGIWAFRSDVRLRMPLRPRLLTISPFALEPKRSHRE